MSFVPQIFVWSFLVCGPHLSMLKESLPRLGGTYDAGDLTWVSYVQCKHPTCYTISLALDPGHILLFFPP